MPQTALKGTPVVGGIAYGPALWPGERPVYRPADGGAVPEAERDAEAERFAAAAATVAGRLRDRASHSNGVAAEVLSATAGLAEDRGWVGAVKKLIGKGEQAPGATIAATEEFAALFTKLGGLMAERVTDLNDVRDRVVAELLGVPEPGVPVPDTPSILVADDLAPADTAGLDPALVTALVTRPGGTGPGAGHRAGHPARRADQPHRDHRAPTEYPLRCRGHRSRRRGRGHRGTGGRHHRRRGDRT